MLAIAMILLFDMMDMSTKFSVRSSLSPLSTSLLIESLSGLSTKFELTVELLFLIEESIILIAWDLSKLGFHIK